MIGGDHVIDPDALDVLLACGHYTVTTADNVKRGIYPPCTDPQCPTARRSAVWEMYGTGATVRQIAAALRMGSNTVRKILKGNE